MNGCKVYCGAVVWLGLGCIFNGAGGPSHHGDRSKNGSKRVEINLSLLSQVMSTITMLSADHFDCLWGTKKRMNVSKKSQKAVGIGLHRATARQHMY